MSRLLRLYPRAWRERYGDELAELVDAIGPGPSDRLDLVRGALIAHVDARLNRLAPRLASAGGPPMPTHTLQRHPTLTGLIAAVVLAPTALFVTLSFLAYQLGVPGVEGFIEPLLLRTIAPEHVVGLFLLATPWLALLLALAPMVGVAAQRVDGELRLTLGLRLRALNALIVGLALAFSGFLVFHLVAEYLLEPR